MLLINPREAVVVWTAPSLGKGKSSKCRMFIKVPSRLDNGIDMVMCLLKSLVLFREVFANFSLFHESLSCEKFKIVHLIKFISWNSTNSFNSRKLIQKNCNIFYFWIFLDVIIMVICFLTYVLFIREGKIFSIFSEIISY